MGRWYLTQLDNGCGLEDAAFLDLQIQENPGGTSVAAGLVVFQQPEMELYQRLVEASRNRLAELELEYGIEKSKGDSVRSKLFASLRATYQERDRLRLLLQFRKAFIDRLLAEGEEAAGATAEDYQRESAQKDREYDSTASALEGKRELRRVKVEMLKTEMLKLKRRPWRHRVAGTHRQGPAGVHPQSRLEVARPRRRPHDNGWRKLDAMGSRMGLAWADLSRSIDMRSRASERFPLFTRAIPA
ncbi:MAG: hypothetical protein MUF86_05685 [Akkermansiaceae bacterium]|nr:hypothetical protein [Akkermansiaceae bacterium]